jgi:hypothetical protein
MKLCSIQYCNPAKAAGYSFKAHLWEATQMADTVDLWPWQVLTPHFEFDAATLKAATQLWEFALTVATSEALPAWQDTPLLLLISSDAGERWLVGTPTTPIYARTDRGWAQRHANARPYVVALQGVLALPPAVVV